MPRKPRQLTDHGYYHLIARGNNRHFILSVPGGHEFFKELLAQSKEKFQWQLSHYCLMSNHFHLLGRIAQGHQLPKLMQYLLFGYSRWYRLKAHYVGHVWQGRYKSPLIEKESYYLECGRYIERNPIRAGLVANAEQYAWSSYRHYALGERDRLIDDDPYYEQLGRVAAERQKRYREFVKIEGPYDELIDAALVQSYF